MNESLINEPYVFDKYLTVRKWNFIKKEIERLQFTNDTSAVLDIQFGEESTCRQYVGVVNLAVIYGFKRYVYINDDFYLFANEPPVVCKGKPFSVDDLKVDFSKVEPPTRWNFFRWKMEAKFQRLIFEIKQSPLLSTGFLILIFIPFLFRFYLKRKSLHLRVAQ